MSNDKSEKSSDANITANETSETDNLPSFGLAVQRVSTFESIRKATFGGAAGVQDQQYLNPANEIIPVFRTMSLDVKQGTNKESRKKQARDFKSIDIHTLPVDKALAKLQAMSVQQGGLPDVVAVTRLKANGLNSITPPSDPYILKILSFLFGGFCFLMWCAAVIIFLSYYPLPQLDNQQPSVYNLALVILLLVVIIFQATFYAWQDWSSASVMKKINNLLASEAIVIRDGKSITIPASNVVVGDIIDLRLGAKVPADCIILECSPDFAVDRAVLTGESIPVSGTAKSTDASFMETKNVAFMGTLVVNGSGKGVVVFTGDNTVMGQIAVLSSKKRTERTLLQKEVDTFVAFVATIAFSCAAICMLVWKFVLLKQAEPQYDIIGMMANICGIIVAFVPEGLPISMSVTLTLIARRMAKQFVLVKNLTTIETLGAVSIICTDKTGTLTTNKMTLRDTGIGGLEILEVSEKAKNLFHKVAAQCCGAEFVDQLDKTTPIADRNISGDATDKAVLRFAESLGSVADVRNSFSKIYEIPFNSRNKWMMTIQQSSENADIFSSSVTLFAKGAPDVLYPKITSILNADGSISPFDKEAKANVNAMQLKWAGEGKRVLAFTYKKLKGDFSGVGSDVEEAAIKAVSELTLVGLGAIVDPPRAETKPTVEKCKEAHIRVAMVTGDFALTAVSIAREVSIVSVDHVDTVADMRSHTDLLSSGYKTSKSGKKTYLRSNIRQIEDAHRAIVVNGSEISDLTEDDWNKICCYRELVFARTSPEQKLRIVDEFKLREEIVAVTGDGVNDSPALKAASVGVAMGGGSEVAMESATLVLINNNFSSLLAGIESGRLCFDNIKKVIMYLIPCGTWSELWPVLLSIFVGIPLPLNTALDLVICCITDIFPSMSLIYEAPESTLMSRPPRNPKKDRLINIQMFAHVYLFIGLMECIFSFIMYFMYWNLEVGVGFNDLLFMYGQLDNNQVVFPNGVNITQGEFLNYSYAGNSVYFVALVMIQLFGNVYASRTRFNSVLQQNPFWGPTRNLYIPAATVLSISVAALFVYLPVLNNLFQTGPIPVMYWFIPIPMGFFILMMDELRKLAVRIMGPESIISKISW
ncbi:hypothetical protein HK100_007460 [Physocladia obscura]|uniref:Cation-transporting P-type ATPase N-terminal domain-containing protein n=1 Tax=Physocladia obscura TaxID=109957 RepID=A0AAD5T4S0_9FUNG|nr:hypothetical protein HK100_007460 [Physocladia obscura]